MRSLNCCRRLTSLGAMLPLLLCLLTATASSVHARSSHSRRHHGSRSLTALNQTAVNQTAVNQTFPYQTCNTSFPWNMNPWKARLVFQQDMNGSTQVVIRVWASACAQAVNLGTLELFVPVESTLKKYQGSFEDAKISIRTRTGTRNATNYTGIIWSPHRRFIRFSKLNLDYETGASAGYEITFTFLNGYMDLLCRRSCRYAIVTGKRCVLGELGWVPVIIVEGPDFQRSPAA